jgi:hypothetical protein
MEIAPRIKRRYAKLLGMASLKRTIAGTTWSWRPALALLRDFVGWVFQELAYGLLPFNREGRYGGFVAEVGENGETLWGGNSGENAVGIFKTRPGIGGSVQK